jgi:hypothetical protein
MKEQAKRKDYIISVLLWAKEVESDFSLQSIQDSLVNNSPHLLREDIPTLSYQTLQNKSSLTILYIPKNPFFILALSNGSHSHLNNCFYCRECHPQNITSIVYKELYRMESLAKTTEVLIVKNFRDDFKHLLLIYGYSFSFINKRTIFFYDYVIKSKMSY